MITSYEREVTVSFNDHEDHATVWTNQPRIKSRMEKYGVKPCSEAGGAGEGAFYKVPKNWIKISPPKKMNYTDEQRKAMAERLKKARGK